MKKLFIILSLWALCIESHAQRIFEYKTSLTGMVATQDQLPMWATTNRQGVIPNTKGGVLQAGFYSDFASKHQIQTAFGFSGVAFASQDKNDLFIDELYLKLRWKQLQLHLGIVHAEEEFNGLSSTNGNILFSNNSRSMPGYRLKTENLSLIKELFSFNFQMGDYLMNDKRYIKNTLAHHKSLHLIYHASPQLDITVGLRHWAQWSGKSPVIGKQPSTLRDYLKVFCAREGGEGASKSDSINVLGNHLGSKYFRVDYNTHTHTLSFYTDMLFEDGSGSRFQNFPDGVYGIYYSSKEKKSWISDIMYEFFYSKKQSGSKHDRPATPEELEQQDPSDPFYGKVILGGGDNYFNNGEYRSGWTYHGQTIGIPFITPHLPNEHGITMGVYNNRIIAHYCSLKGYLFQKLPYQLRLSYSINYGTYKSPIKNKPKQFSFGLEAGILRNLDLPFHIDLGVYGDCGKLYEENFGFTISLSRKGLIKS